MMKNVLKICFACLLTSLFFACTGQGKSASQDKKKENLQAKQSLQGIWCDGEDGEVALRAEGDTIYYPDTISQPVYFQIIDDTLLLRGANTVKYAIVKQSAHLFEFKNQNGEVVKLVKSTDESDIDQFMQKRQNAVNQKKLIKKDTVVVLGEKRFHSYVQINPTTYKVIKRTYNDDGVEVDNVYYDNIIHVSVFQGSSKVFSKDFYKQDFSRKVPQQFLAQSVLSDMIFENINQKGLHYNAHLCIPDSYLSYIVEVTISFEGGLSMKINS